MDQLKHGASRLPIDSRGLLITHVVGVAKIMGVPFRTLCPGEGLERDLAWLAVRVGEQAAGVAKLFAHIGLKAVYDLAEERHGQVIRTTRPTPLHCQSQKPKCRCSSLDTALPRASTAWLAIFPQSSPNSPSAFDLLVATLAGCAGESPTNLTAATLRRRPSGCCDDSAGPAHQFGRGGRALNQRNRGSVGAAGR